ncbi:MAG TPA: hypothetical protein VFB20_08135, partial [Burkholderiales bacterium]|nr:hypothetical protein [Burkholderiales bacterium]
LFLWRGVGTLTLARLAWLAFFAGVGYALFVYSAFRFAPAAHGSVLLPGVLPFASAIAAYLLLGERPDARRKRSLLLIALGAGVLLAHIPFQPATNGPHRLTWLGEPLTLFVSAGVLLVTIGALIGAQPAAAR